MSFRLTTLLVLVLVIAVMLSAARWAAGEGRVADFAAVILHFSPTLWVAGTRDWVRGRTSTAIPMLIVMVPVLAVAAALYAQQQPGSSYISPMLFVLLVSWMLQIPVVIYLFLKPAPSQSPHHVLDLDTKRLRKVIVDVPKIGPAFEVPIASWSEIRAVLLPSRQIPVSVVEVTLGAIILDIDGARSVRVELWDQQNRCAYSIDGAHYRGSCETEAVLRLLQSIH